MRIAKKLLLAVMALALVAPVAVRAQDSMGGSAVVQPSSPIARVPEKKQEVKDENDEYRHSPTVVKLGAMLGMNPEQAATAFTVFNFLILAIAVGYGLLKSLPKTFRARTSAIQKQLVDARTATEEATARLNLVEARLSKLDDQIAGLKTQAAADSERDAAKIKQSVEDEKAKIVAAAEAEIASASSLARREIQQYAAELAIEQAARKLIVTAETDRLLVESFAQKLGAGYSDNDKAGSN